MANIATHPIAVMKRTSMPRSHLRAACGKRQAALPAGRTAAIITATAFALVIAACGASQPARGTSGSTNTVTGRISQAVAFTRCMRSRGVSNWPDPSRTLGNFPGAPHFGFNLQGIHGLEGGASGSWVGPAINAAIGRCLHLQHLANSRVPWGSSQR
jgi:hypothetical protein